MFTTEWNEDVKLLTTRLASPNRVEDIRDWKASLEEAIAKIEGPFKLLVDMRGYEYNENPDAHQEMRVVVPTLLAEHGLRTAIMELFPEATLEVKESRATAAAVAYVHHNENKMAVYNTLQTLKVEQFFTDRAEAERWILAA